MFHSANKTIVHALGAISYALAQWLIITFAVRFISLEAAGLYAFYLAIFTPASILLAFGLRNSIASDSTGAYAHQDYARARTIGLGAIAIVLVFVLLVSPRSALIASAVFFMKALEMYVEPIYGEWIKTGRAHRFGYSKFFRLILFLILFAFGYFVFGATELLLYCYPIASLIALVAYDRRGSELRDRLGVSRFEVVCQLVLFSLPLAVGSFVLSLVASLPRLGVGYLIDSESVAVYVLLTYFVSLSAIPLQSISQISIPIYSRMRGLREIFSSSTFKKYAALTGVVGLCFFLFMYLLGAYVVGVLYGVEDGYAPVDFLLVGLAGIVHYCLLLMNSVFVAARLFKVISRSAFVGLAMVSVLLLPTVLHFGVSGAYLTYLMSLVGTLCFMSVCAFRVAKDESSRIDPI